MSEQNTDRRAARMHKAVMAGMMIQQKLGGIDVRESIEHVRIASLASLAECRGLWRFLIERGLASEAQYQDYMDKGYAEVLAQIEAAATQVYVGH